MIVEYMDRATGSQSDLRIMNVAGRKTRRCDHGGALAAYSDGQHHGSSGASLGQKLLLESPGSEFLVVIPPHFQRVRPSSNYLTIHSRNSNTADSARELIRQSASFAAGSLGASRGAGARLARGGAAQ